MPIIYDNVNHSVTLCTRRTCCPTVTLVGNDRVKIVDDDGHSVTMSIEEAKLLVPGIDMLNEKKKVLLHD